VTKIEIGRYSELLRRVFSMVGQVEVAGEMSPEISPVFELETALNQEWDFLKAVKQCSTSEAIAANVGAAGQFRLRNPAASGMIATVHQLTMTAITGGLSWAVNVAPGTVDLANTALTTARDARWPSGATLQASALLATFQNAVGAVPTGAGTVARWTSAASRPVTYSEQIILTPGSLVTFGCLNANLPVQIYASWHERQLLAVER